MDSRFNEKHSPASGPGGAYTAQMSHAEENGKVFRTCLRKFFVFVSIFFILFAVMPAKAEKDIIFGVYESLSGDYINHLSNREITLKGLKALSNRDPQFRISPTSQKIYLYYGRKMVKSYPLPMENDSIGQWAALSQNIIADAGKLSAQIDVVDFEMPDHFAAAVFNGLDGYSHYYGEFANSGAPEGGEKTWQRHFAVRQIDDVLLIKIRDFQQGVSSRVRESVNECSACSGIILDLRGNHGGLLDEAIKIANLFLDEGIITYTMGKGNNKPQYYTADSGDIFSSKPLVVLVDGYSASAAEILSAALSEQNRAVLIGTKTYGKGTVQDVMKVGKSGIAAVTTAFFYSPSGQKIDKSGLKPAICTGQVKSIQELGEALCSRQDRGNEDIDVEIAVLYLKNDL